MWNLSPDAMGVVAIGGLGINSCKWEGHTLCRQKTKIAKL